MQKYYLAYGSNLNMKQMKHRCKGAVPVGKTILNNYKLAYKGGAEGFAYLTIEKCEGSYVPLGIYQISLLDEFALDRYEGYPRAYTKKYFPININGKTHKALIYIMNEQFDYNLPSVAYVNTCREGYRDFQFDETILNNALKEVLQIKIKKLKK